MRRTLLEAPATLIAIAALAGPAAAEPPVHVREIAKDVEATIPPPPECTGPATALDLTFHLQSHAIFTPTSFHFTGTTTEHGRPATRTVP